MSNKQDNISSASTSSHKDEIAGELFSNQIAKESPLEDKAFSTAKTGAVATKHHATMLPWKMLLIITSALVLAGLLLLLGLMYISGKNQKKQNLSGKFNTTPLDLSSLNSGSLGGNSTVLLNGALVVNGPVTAQSFSGDGANLSNVDATRLNHQPGSFYQNANNINAGTLSDARLSPNVALLNANQTFTGNNSFTGNVVLPNNITIGSFAYSWPTAQPGVSTVLLNNGSGSLSWGDFTGLCPTCIINGGNSFGATVIIGSNDAQDVELRSAGVTRVTFDTAGTATFTGSVVATDFVGDGSALSSLNANNITSGTLNNARLTPAVTLAGNTFNGAGELVLLDGLGFLPSLNGSNLNSLNASALGSGTVNDARLSANVALLNVAQTYLASNIFTPNQTFNGGITTNSIVPSSTLTIGTPTQNLTLQGDGTVVLTSTTGGFTTTVGFANVPVGNVVYKFDRATVAGTYTICTSVGNCPGSPGSVSTLGGTTNKIAKFSGAFSIADSSISDTGSAVAIQPGANSLTTFAVHDATGAATILDVDTSNSRVGVNNAAPTYPLDVTGDINSSTGLRIGGTLVCDNTGCTASGGGGFYIQNGTSTQANANFNFQSAAAGSIGGVIRGAVAQTANLQEWQNSGGTTLAYVDASGNISTSAQFQINGVQIASSNLSDGANLAKLNGTQSFTGVNTFTGDLLVQPAVDSATAFVVKNQAGSSDVFKVDTTTNRVGINNATPGYALDSNGDINSSSALRVGGTIVCTITGCTATGGSGSYIQNSTSIQASANFAIQSAAAGSIGGIIRGAASQTADLQQWQNSSGTVLSYINSSGNPVSSRYKFSEGVFYDMWYQNSVGDVRLFAYNADALRITSGSSNGLYIAKNIKPWGDSAAAVALIVQGATSQTADLQQWQTSTGSLLASVKSDGKLNINTTGAVGIGINLYSSSEYSYRLLKVENSIVGGPTALGVFRQGNSAGIVMWSNGGSQDHQIQFYDGTNAVRAITLKGTTTTGSVGIGAGITSSTDVDSILKVSGNSASTIALIVRGAAGQTANLQEWQNSGGTVLASVNASGYLGLNGATAGVHPLRITAASGRAARIDGAIGINTDAQTSGLIFGVNGLASAVAVTIRGAAGQTANLTEWQDSTGTQIAAVDASGRFVANTLGTGDNSTYLCRNSSNQIATCSGSATGSAFVQGGNSFGATANLGTNDGNALAFITSGTEKMRLTTGGVLEINSTGTPGTVEKFRVNTPVLADNAANAMITTSAIGSKGLVIQGVAGQTANLQEWQSSTGTVLNRVASTGAMQLGFNIALQGEYSAGGSFVDLIKRGSGNSVFVGSTSGADTFLQGINLVSIGNGNGSFVWAATILRPSITRTGNFGSASYLWADGYLGSSSSGVVALHVVGNTSQTGNLQQWENVSNTVLLSVTAAGAIQGGPSGGAVVINGGTAGASTAGGAVTLQAAAGGATTGAGGAVSITSGAGTTSGAGGAMTLTTGAGAGSSNGGALTLQSGAGGATFGNGGAINITAGNGTATNTNGGAIAITAGTSVGNQPGGALTVTAGGAAGATGGTLTLKGGNSTGSTGGGVAIQGGTTASGVGGGITLTAANGVGNAGGAVTITSGSATTGNIGGGAITLTTGVGFGNASGGALTLQAGAAGAGGSAGGSVNILAGAGGGTSGSGGSVNLTAGAAIASNSLGGALTFTSGAGNGSQAGGQLTLQGGAGGATGTGASILINSGAGGSTSGNSGSVNIYTNDVTSGTAGNITLNVGTSTTGNGSILIGTSSLTQTITIGNTTGATGVNVRAGSGLVNVSTTQADATTVAQFNNAGATNCTVQPGGTGFACSSDARLKTNVMNLDTTNATDIVSKLQGVSFNWITNPDGQTQVGFIAQDLMKYIPSAVSTDASGHYVANYTAIIPYLVEAFKNQQAQIDTLKSTAGGTSVDVLKELADAKAVTLSGDLTVGGNVVISGRTEASSDNKGTIAIPIGQTSVHVVLPSTFSKKPSINLTPGDFIDGQYRVTNVTKSGFTIELQKPQADIVDFDWQAL